jgi:hypothetical protein
MILWLQSVRTSCVLSELDCKKRGKSACAPLAPFKFSNSLMSLFLQHLSQGRAGMLALQVELSQAREAVASVEAACVTVVPAV